jgi:hypothetical protein
MAWGAKSLGARHEHSTERRAERVAGPNPIVLERAAAAHGHQRILVADQLASSDNYQADTERYRRDRTSGTNLLEAVNRWVTASPIPTARSPGVSHRHAPHYE